MIVPTQLNRGKLWVAIGFTQSARRQVKASLPVPEDASLRSFEQPTSGDHSGRSSGWYCRCITDQQEDFCCQNMAMPVANHECISWLRLGWTSESWVPTSA